MRAMCSCAPSPLESSVRTRTPANSQSVPAAAQPGVAADGPLARLRSLWRPQLKASTLGGRECDLTTSYAELATSDLFGSTPSSVSFALGLRSLQPKHPMRRGPQRRHWEACHAALIALSGHAKTEAVFRSSRSSSWPSFPRRCVCRVFQRRAHCYFFTIATNELGDSILRIPEVLP